MAHQWLYRHRAQGRGGRGLSVPSTRIAHKVEGICQPEINFSQNCCPLVVQNRCVESDMPFWIFFFNSLPLSDYIPFGVRQECKKAGEIFLLMAGPLTLFQL